MAPRLPSQWVDDLYQRANIVDVVSAYLPLKKDGHRYWGLCPFHNEKTPSFSVNPDLNLYYCFGCKAGGNVIQFIMEMEKLSFFEAATLLAERMHIPLPQMVEDPEYEKRKSLRERLYAANKRTAKYYHEKLFSKEGEQIREYFYRRGLNDHIIRRFGLGASLPSWSDLTDMLLKEGFTLEELRQAGLTVVKEESNFDFFRGRAMFPIMDQYGNVLAFGGRAMGDSMPKYLNTGDTPVFNKRKGVYAVNLLKKERNLKQVMLVEGYMDVVALSQAGIKGVVATLGTALTEEQARLLKRYSNQVIIAYDGDNAGQMAIERALEIFSKEGLDAKALVFENKMDPDEYIREKGIEAFEDLKPLSAVRYKMMRLEQSIDLSNDDGKIEYAKKCAEILTNVKEPVELETYLKDIGIKTGFDRQVLLAQIGKSLPDLMHVNNENRATINKKRTSHDQPLKAEQTLISLLASGALKEGMVKEDDFEDENLKKIVRLLLEKVSPATIIEQAETENQRTLAAHIFSIQNGELPETSAQIASDCLRSLRLNRMEKERDNLKERLKISQDAKERLSIMKEIMALNNEVTRLKRDYMV